MQFNHDDEDDEIELREVLYIEEVDVPDDRPPVTGSEYVRLVQREARHYPDVVITSKRHQPKNAHISKKYDFNEMNSQSNNGDERVPIDTQRKFVSSFSDYRMKIDLKRKHFGKKIKLPQKGDIEAWCKICLGDEFLSKLNPYDFLDYKTESLSDNLVQSLPDMKMILSMKNLQVMQLVEYNATWLENFGYSNRQGIWIFSLLAAIEKPLLPESVNDIRRIAKKCISLRYEIYNIGEQATDSSLSGLNLLICIVGRYFEQIDLADEGT